MIFSVRAIPDAGHDVPESLLAALLWVARFSANSQAIESTPCCCARACRVLHDWLSKTNFSRLVLDDTAPRKSLGAWVGR